MAAFACFSTSKEKTTGAYKALIKRFKQKTQEEVCLWFISFIIIK